MRVGPFISKTFFLVPYWPGVTPVLLIPTLPFQSYPQTLHFRQFYLLRFRTFECLSFPSYLSILDGL